MITNYSSKHATEPLANPMNGVKLPKGEAIYVDWWMKNNINIKIGSIVVFSWPVYNYLSEGSIGIVSKFTGGGVNKRFCVPPKGSVITFTQTDVE